MTFPAAPQRAVVAWALMAVLNLSAGLVIASLPERRSDLDNMRRWERQWLVEDLDVYAPAEASHGLPRTPSSRCRRWPLRGRDHADVDVPLLGGFRALLQFSLLALTFGLLGDGIRPRGDRSERGLPDSHFVPQIGIPFLLWAVFTRRWLVVGAAGACLAAGTMVYCLKSWTSPSDGCRPLPRDS